MKTTLKNAVLFITLLILTGCKAAKEASNNQDLPFTVTVAPEITKQIRTDKTQDEFKVIIYYPSWESEQFEKIQFDIVTHIMYAFAIPTENGNLLPLDNEELAKKLIQLAHENNTSIQLSVGGWSYNDIPLESTFMKATESTEKIITLGDEIVAMCLNYGFDGVDLDWEHPKISEGSQTQYEALVTYLAEKLHEKDKLFSAAVLSGVSTSGEIFQNSAAYSDVALNSFDFINIMAYDGDGINHSSYEFAILSSGYWLNTRGIPRKKLVLGVPFYARPGWISYKDILLTDPKAYKKDFFEKDNVTNYYNGIQTIKGKTAYALDHLGGIMVWEITHDTAEQEKSLLTAIGNVISDNTVEK